MRFASLRPLSVSGMSVIPVWRPLRLHTVSPCLIANTFTFASSLHVVGARRREDARRGCFLSPPPARDLGHVVPETPDVFLVIDELAAHRLFRVGSARPELRHAI